MAVTRILTDGVANTAISRIDGDLTLVGAAANVLWDKSADDLIFADNAKAVFGTGNDLQIYHDSSNSYVTNAVGALKIATETSGIAITLGHSTSEVTVADNLTVTGTLTGTLATAAQGSVTSLGTLTALQVDNLNINTNTISATSGALNITPAGGSAIVLDGTVNVDAGVITGATSITSTAFVGALTGNVTGNASGTAATVTTAAQGNITSVGTLTALTVSGSETHGTNGGDTRFVMNSANQYTLKFLNAGNVAGHIGGGGADVLRFSNAAGGTVMQMSNGGLGIGTTTPGAALEIYRNQSTTHARIKINNPHADAYGSGLSLVTNSRSWTVEANDNASGIDNAGAFGIRDETASAWRFVIKSDGYTGINTHAPGQPLEIFTGSTTAGVRINRYGSGVYYSDILQTSSPERLAFKVGNGSAISEKMAITGDGTVGIGTTAPYTTTKLNVTGATSTNTTAYNTTSPPAAGQLDIRSTDAYGTQLGGKLTFSGLAAGDGSSNARAVFGAIQGYKANSGINNSGGGLTLSATVNATGVLTERIRILEQGNVGIGTTAPEQKLHVAGHLHVGAGNSSNIYMDDSDEGDRIIHCNSNNIGFLNSSGGWGAYCTDAGLWQCASGLSVTGIITSSGSITGTTLYGSSFVFSGRGAFQGQQSVGTLRTTTGSLGGLELYSGSSTNAAFMAFHRPGAYASYFGIDTDNYFAVGGWSAGAGLANFKCNVMSKASGSFRIDHPLPALNETHDLFHSFIEGPQADNLYRGKATLVDGTLAVNIDESAGMTEGTFVLLNREVQCFTSNESDWDAVRGSVNGNILTIECQNQNSTAIISWLVIGERKDKHMYDTDWTDENGKVIVESLKTAMAVENDPSLAD